LSGLRLNDLTVGQDGRNRCMLSAFKSKTGRNQPSNAQYIFGHSVWLRGLIRPEPGYALCYIDWEQQEFGIAAALSGDERQARAPNRLLPAGVAMDADQAQMILDASRKHIRELLEGDV
jgi:DNA polymerase I